MTIYLIEVSEVCIAIAHKSTVRHDNIITI